MESEVRVKAIMFPTGADDGQLPLIIWAIRQLFKVDSLDTSLFGVEVCRPEPDSVELRFVDDAREWVQGKGAVSIIRHCPTRSADEESRGNKFWRTVEELLRSGPYVTGYPMVTMLMVAEGEIEFGALDSGISFDLRDATAGQPEVLSVSAAFLGKLLRHAADKTGCAKFICSPPEYEDKAARLIEFVDDWFPEALIETDQGEKISLQEFVKGSSHLVPDWFAENIT